MDNYYEWIDVNSYWLFILILVYCFFCAVPKKSYFCLKIN